jgi:phosphatidylserine/phosphatidylglycerophosphate/cardiolipin synthase-like enzyme
VDKSRSFGIVTRNARVVQEAIRLFDADFDRKPYSAGCDRFIVSPENSRERLMAFIKGARKELLIYDPKVSHTAIIKLLVERAKAGVDVKIIGKLAGHRGEMQVEKFPGRRLHVRAIVRDGRAAFVGSQSLRRLELEKRREVGILIHDSNVVREMKTIFDGDWAQTPSGKKEAKKATKAEKADKKDQAEAVLAAS